jgi:hypothetical protein
VIAQAMEHEFLTAARAGAGDDVDGFMSRAKEYAKQALEQAGPPSSQRPSFQ